MEWLTPWPTRGDIIAMSQCQFWQMETRVRVAGVQTRFQEGAPSRVECSELGVSPSFTNLGSGLKATYMRP